MARHLTLTRPRSRDSGVQLTLDYGQPRATASVYAPTGRRRLWWLSYRCPHCHGTHLGRSRRFGDIEGTRRSGCGRMIWLDIATVDTKGDTQIRGRLGA
ncbi:hypothetical protein [Actinomadura miaoliensis]|uniref:Transposase n=1 Tax=Actinomadura miaoliensis TaxID=430685 RepID=A0ABP7X1D6_9ACTN